MYCRIAIAIVLLPIILPEFDYAGKGRGREGIVMAWEAIEYFTYLAGLVHYSLLFYMVLVPTTLLLITWLCISNAREI